MAFWITFIWWIVSLVVGELLRPKPNIENARPANLGDFQFPTAEEGRVVPVIWGTVRINGPNVLWYGDLEAVAIKEKVKTGLWSSQTIIKGYKYYLGIQLGLCRGPLKAGTITDVGIRRIWVDDEILRPDTAGWVYDGPIVIDEPEFFGEDTGGLGGTMRVYDGNLTQSVNTYMAAQTGEIDPTLLPAYRGTAYLMFEHFYVGNTSSLRPWNFEVRRIPDGLGLGANATVNNGDANPMNVLFEVMTSAEWGVGVTNINLSQWASVAAVLKAEGNGYSRVLDSTVEAADVIGDIERQVDGVLEYDAENSVYLFRLIRETDYPSPVSLVPAFTEDNILELEFARESWQETTNQVRVGYVDKNKDFKGTFAVAQDMANQIIQQGDNVVATESFPGCSTAALANDLAWRQLRTYSYPLAKGKLKATRAIYNLQPGDLASITWPPLELVNFYVRINRIDPGSLDAGEIIYDWTQDVFQTPVSVFADPEGTNWNLGSGAPLPPAAFRLFNAPPQYSDSNAYQQLAIVAARANNRQRYYDVYYVENTGSTPTTLQFEDNYNARVTEYTPTALLAEDLPLTQNVSPMSFDDDVFLVNNGIDMDVVDYTANVSELNGAVPPNLALIDDEIIFFESVTAVASPTGHYRLNGVRRGMLDTKPAAHSTGARIWFFTYGVGLIDAETTVGNTGWVRLQPVGATGSLPLDSSPTNAIQGSIVISNRYQGNAPPANPEINGTRFDDFMGGLTGGTLQITWKGRDCGLTTTRADTQESANRDHRAGTTYSLRIYWAGKSPESLVYSLDNIPFASGYASPNGGKMNVSGFLREPGSPLASPRASQNYHVEFWSTRLGYDSQVWEAEIDVTGYGLSYGGELTAGGIGDALLPSPYPFSPTPSPTPTAAFSPEPGIPVRGGYGGIDFEGSALRPGETLTASDLFPGAGFTATNTWKLKVFAPLQGTSSLTAEIWITYFDPVNSNTIQTRTTATITNSMNADQAAAAIGASIAAVLPEDCTTQTNGTGTLTVNSPGELRVLVWNRSHFVQGYLTPVPLTFSSQVVPYTIEIQTPISQIAFIDYYTVDADGNEQLAPEASTTQWGTTDGTEKAQYRSFRYTIEALHDHERTYMGGASIDGVCRWSEYNIATTNVTQRRNALANLAKSLNASAFGRYGYATVTTAYLSASTGTWAGTKGLDGPDVMTRECIVLAMNPNFRIVRTEYGNERADIGLAGYQPLIKEARIPRGSAGMDTAATITQYAHVAIKWNQQIDAPSTARPYLLRLKGTTGSVTSYFAYPSASDVTRKCLHDMWADLRQQIISGSPYEARLIIGADGFNTGLSIWYPNNTALVEMVTPYGISPQDFNYTSVFVDYTVTL